LIPVHEEVIPVRLIFAAILLTLTACTIREESFAPRGDEPSSSGLSLTPRADLNAPDDRDSSPCGNGFASGSDLQEYRDGTQSLFCD